ncbi:MAG TPA: isochorismatase family cysteine hydrolase [Puia sp.]|nr:isochorismatase family cysteine hydrolase [Puia sp.]
MSIQLAATPDPIDIDPAKTAVIVVDMENDFVSKGGMFDLMGIDRTPVKKIIEPIQKVLAAARASDLTIVYLKMGYRQDLSDLGGEGSPNRIRHLRFHVGDTITAPNGSKSRILVRDSWGTEIIPELKPAAGDIVLYKSRFSGFYNTDLDGILRKLGKKYLLFTGTTTSICVESTVRDAMFRDYSPIVLEDCTEEPIGSNFPRTNHEASMTVFRVIAWVSSSANVITALAATRKPAMQ